MDANEYQDLAARTLIQHPDMRITEEEFMVLWNAMGIGGEAGEVMEVVKKGIFHRHGLDIGKLKNELGDVLWYVAALCTTLGLDMETIMHENILKLKDRYPEGFDVEKSKH